MLVVTMKQMTMTMMLARARFPECLFMKFHVVQHRGRSLRHPGAYTERFSQYPPTAPRPAKTFREVLLISWARGRLQVRASKPLTSVLGICTFALRFATLFVAAGLALFSAMFVLLMLTSSCFKFLLEDCFVSSWMVSTTSFSSSD